MVKMICNRCERTFELVHPRHIDICRSLICTNRSNKKGTVYDHIALCPDCMAKFIELKEKHQDEVLKFMAENKF